MSHQLILEHIKGATSQDPVTLDHLVEATKLLPDALNALLDQMYCSIPSMINKVKRIKDGRTEILVWPTGVVEPLTFNNRNSSQIKRQERPPRVPVSTTSPAAQSVKAPDKRPKSAIIMEYLRKHGSASSKELLEVIGGSAIKAFIYGQLNRGEVIQERIDGRVFYRLPTPDQTEAQPELPPATENCELKSKLPLKKPQAQFRVAITSDYCLMLFGVQDQVIELDTAQTQTLFEFLSHSKWVPEGGGSVISISEELANELLTFLEGFEDDPVQEWIDDLLWQLRQAMKEPS